MRVEKTVEFRKWFESADNTTRIRVAARLQKIEAHGHLGEGLYELKWSIGLRVYFSIATDEQGNLFIALFGGGKDGQSRDISKARAILERHRSD